MCNMLDKVNVITNVSEYLLMKKEMLVGGKVWPLSGSYLLETLLLRSHKHLWWQREKF